MKPVTPVSTAPLFGELHGALVNVLRGLEAPQWEMETVAGRWRVRDVAAHLLDVQLRRLSLQRDGHTPPAPGRDLSGYADLVDFLNQLNHSWVAALDRASPRLLVDFLDVVGPQFAAFMASLDPLAPAVFPVAWAGEDASANWFDVGRDYTELWHHQAQIRMAVGAPLLLERRWLHPVLALAVRALPRALAGVTAAQGTAVTVRVDGEAGGVWSAVSDPGGWAVYEGAPTTTAATLRMEADTAWRLFFSALPPEDTGAAVKATGDPALVEAVLAMRSVMV